MAAKKTAGPGRDAKSPRKGASKKKARKRARKGAKKSLRKSAKPVASATAEAKLYTLTQLGQMASVSMPTLQKYKRLYQDRIPSVGEGRKQRYPREAVAVLEQLKKENLARRGRPRKSPAKAAKAAKRTSAVKKAAAKGAAAASDLLTLSEISRITNISYPTVSRYVKLFLDKIPHVGAGRLRRFPREAVAAFEALRSASRPGRPPKRTAAAPVKRSARGGGAAQSSGLEARLRRIEKAQAGLAKQLAGVLETLKKPLQVTIKGR